MIKAWGVIMAIWLALALTGGVMDGKIIADGSQDVVNGLPQVTVASNPWQGAGYNPISWFTAPAKWLGNVMGVLLLNSSLFNSDWTRLFRWLLLGLAVAPIVVELIARALGRASG